MHATCINVCIYWCTTNDQVTSFALRVEEDKNIADLSPYDKNKQTSSHIRLKTYKFGPDLLVPSPQ